MKIAIHHREGSFSERWIAYCKKQDISHKIVNCYDTDIIEQLKDCNVLMWHFHHNNYKDSLLAKSLMFSLEHLGLKIFPDFNTSWHFDNKVSQKYLMEAINAPLVPTYVFYDKLSAKNWIKTTSFPKVFKLKGGAGAANVSLVRDSSEANKIINKAFGKGFSQFNRWGFFKEQFRKMINRQGDVTSFFKAIIRLFISTEFAKMSGKEKGYVYFQDFIQNNNFDIRVIVIGDKAFSLKRMVRENDFRASGSGNIIYLNDKSMDKEMLKISFETSLKLKAQCIAFDFIYDSDGSPLIVEISYGFSSRAYDSCPGYWTQKLEWHEGAFVPQEWMIEYLNEEKSY